MIEHRSSTFSSRNQPYDIDRYAEKGGSAKRPVVVLLHGVDGLGTQSGAQIRTFADQIAGAGFLVVVPHYFDGKDGADTQPLPVLLEQRLPRLALYPPRVAAAVDFAVKEPDADPGHLGLVGLSLGGGLALDYALSATAGTVNALVDFFGHISDPTIFANAGRLPPTLILHNNADEIVKIKHSSQPLLDALKKTTVIHDHCFYDDVNPIGHHPFLPGAHADVDSRARSVRWFETHLMRSS